MLTDLYDEKQLVEMLHCKLKQNLTAYKHLSQQMCWENPTCAQNSLINHQSTHRNKL